MNNALAIATANKQTGSSRSWPLPLLAIALTVCGFATQLVNVCLTAGNLKNFAIGGFFQLVGVAILIAVWLKIDVRKLGEKRHVVWGAMEFKAFGIIHTCWELRAYLYNRHRQ